MGRRLGAHERYEALIRTHYADVRRLCAVILDEDSADDLAQETFLRAGRTLRHFREQSAPRTWILAVARHACLDELRRRGRAARRRDALAGVQRTLPGVAESPAGAVETRQLIAGLDPDRAEAFVLTQMIGLSYAEAAAVCECPVGTIRSRVARAREDLIAALPHTRVGHDQRGSGSGCA